MVRRSREYWKKEILKLLRNGPLTTSQIHRALNKLRDESKPFDPSYIRKLLAELRKEGLIVTVGYEHRLTLQGKRIADNPEELKKVRVHNIRVICYVLRANYDKIRELGKEIQMKNWVAYTIDLAKVCEELGIPPIQAKIRINIAKTTTAIVFLPPFYASSRTEIQIEAHNMYNKIRRILQLIGIILDEDWKNLYVPSEYAFKVDDPLDPGTEIRLGRPAVGINGRELSEEARVWVDESEGREAESNCLGYTDNYLLMPERIADIHPRVHKIEQKVDKIDERLSNIEKQFDEYKGFIAETKDLLAQYERAQMGLIEASKALAENIKTHIPYVKNASKALEEITKTVQSINQITNNLIKLQESQKQQQSKLMEVLTNLTQRDCESVPLQRDEDSEKSRATAFVLILFLAISLIILLEVVIRG